MVANKHEEIRTLASIPTIGAIGTYHAADKPLNLASSPCVSNIRIERDSTTDPRVGSGVFWLRTAFERSSIAGGGS
jgi:hypothetical protein